MASQSFNLEASGSNSSVHANQSGSQVDLTLRLGLSKESDKILPHFGPMNLPHAHLNFTAPYTTHQVLLSLSLSLSLYIYRYMPFSFLVYIIINCLLFQNSGHLAWWLLFRVFTMIMDLLRLIVLCFVSKL